MYCRTRRVVRLVTAFAGTSRTSAHVRGHREPMDKSKALLKGRSAELNTPIPMANFNKDVAPAYSTCAATGITSEPRRSRTKGCDQRVLLHHAQDRGQCETIGESGEPHADRRKSTSCGTNFECTCCSEAVRGATKRNAEFSSITPRPEIGEDQRTRYHTKNP